MAITYGNVDNWLKKSNVNGFALTAYPTPGKPYIFNLNIPSSAIVPMSTRPSWCRTSCLSCQAGRRVRRALSRSAGNRLQPPQRSS